MVHYGIVNAELVIEFMFGQAAAAFTSLSAKDVSTFEVEILIKSLSSEFLLNILRKVKVEQAIFAKNLLERTIHFGSTIQVEDVAASIWLPWTVNNIVKALLRSYFIAECGNVDVRQQLIEIAKNNGNYSQEISVMLAGSIESLN